MYNYVLGGCGAGASCVGNRTVFKRWFLIDWLPHVLPTEQINIVHALNLRSLVRWFNAKDNIFWIQIFVHVDSAVSSVSFNDQEHQAKPFSQFIILFLKWWASANSEPDFKQIFLEKYRLWLSHKTYYTWFKLLVCSNFGLISARNIAVPLVNN